MEQLYVGGILMVGPAVGFLVTLWGLHRAFDAVGGSSVPPDQKANQLAEGISMSMDATMYGLVAHLLGWIVLAST